MRESLSDGIITLRRYCLEDTNDMHDAACESVAEVHPWMPWCRPGFGREEGRDWVARQVKAWDERKSFEFVIRTESGVYVGGGGINGLNEHDRFANLAYWIRSHHAGRGYATRAARLLAAFGLTDLSLQRVEIVAAVTNLASQRVAEKAGAMREGILRNRVHLHGRAHDAVMFSLISQKA